MSTTAKLGLCLIVWIFICALVFALLFLSGPSLTLYLKFVGFVMVMFTPIVAFLVVQDINDKKASQC